MSKKNHPNFNAAAFVSACIVAFHACLRGKAKQLPHHASMIEEISAFAMQISQMLDLATLNASDENLRTRSYNRQLNAMLDALYDAAKGKPVVTIESRDPDTNQYGCIIIANDPELTRELLRVAEAGVEGARKAELDRLMQRNGNGSH